MSIVTPISLSPALSIDCIYRLTVAQYHHMITSGILDEDDPVELLEGILVHKTSKTPSHCVALGLLFDRVSSLIPDNRHIQMQDPVTFSDSEPEPDLVIARGDTRTYSTRHPGPEDVGLLVEVADASLTRDRGFKKQLYARVGIPFYWIVNLMDRQIEVYSQPSGPDANPTYTAHTDYRPGDAVPVSLDGKELGAIPVSDLLP